jgi:hypothetical protein
MKALLKTVAVAVLGSGAHQAAAVMSSDQVIQLLVSAASVALAYWLNPPNRSNT